MTHKKLSRRDAIKLLGAAVGATALANLPAKWSKPEIITGVLPAHAQTSCTYAAGAQTFATPGSYDFIVPCEVTSLNVDAFGAQGGGRFAVLGLAGLGGQTTHTIPVTPGETLTVLVGGAGGFPTGGGSVGGLGGVNGGGTGGSGHTSGYGGGGWSGVMRGVAMLVVAGGGGGGGSDNGGDGGGTTGAAGDGFGGGGGTQAAGGAGGVGDTNGTAGSAGQGGDGGDINYGGGGGGGGYFGGGGGSGETFDGGGGGGGSSYPPGASTLAQGVRAGDGQVDLWW